MERRKGKIVSIIEVPKEIIMEKFNEIGLKNYSVIAFGGRKFYLPLNACAVYYQGEVLHIDFQGNNDAYGIVNGIRCYDVISYNKKIDTLETHIKEYVLDGVHVTCENLTSVSISCEGQKITVPGITGHITPCKYYEELAADFLSEFPQMDTRIRDFLRKHPECFGNSSERSDLLINYVGAWLTLHTYLTNPSPELGKVGCPPALDEEIFELFVKETPGL